MGTEKLPEQFTSTVPDDAMSAHIRAGTECIFRSDLVPRYGDGVLVVDKHQQLHLRLYAQGDRPGHWLAKADNKAAFRDLDSEADGLRVLAVAAGEVKRW